LTYGNIEGACMHLWLEFPLLLHGVIYGRGIRVCVCHTLLHIEVMQDRIMKPSLSSP